MYLQYYIVHNGIYKLLFTPNATSKIIRDAAVLNASNPVHNRIDAVKSFIVYLQ